MEQNSEFNGMDVLKFSRMGNFILGAFSIGVGAVLLFMVLGDNMRHGDKWLMCVSCLGGGFSLLTLSSILWALEQIVRK